MDQPVIKIENLEKSFKMKSGSFKRAARVRAVNKVSLEIKKGETLGLVGESGCGKSTLGRTILKVHEPDGGKILFQGTDITGFSRGQMRPYRRKMQMIFQDPYASLNPRFTVGELIGEPMEIYDMYSRTERENRVQDLMRIVGLKPDHIRRYPHEFSGGQRQRIGIARTLALDPEFIVCDEPISALDVSIQSQIINLLEKIQAERQLSYLFIAHDLGMVRHISHRIGVMYLGYLVEVGEADEVYQYPLHPYTRALMSAVPEPDPRAARAQQRIMLEGEIPNPLDIPKGCPFCTRCPQAKPQCREERPELKEVDGRQAACLLL